MIKSKRPNTVDEYGDIGFIQAKVGDEYKNIDHIYDSAGNVIFQQGYLNEYQGADNFGVPAIGKPLVDYTIWGNNKQDGFPTYDNPIEPKFCGERTENLFDPENCEVGKQLNGNGNLGNISFSVVTDYIDSSGHSAVTLEQLSTTGRSSWAYYIAISAYDANKVHISRSYVYNQKDQLHTTLTRTLPDNTKYIRASIILEDKSPLDPIISVQPMLNWGSEALPYEPYGYKIPIVSRGVNLAWTGWAEDCISRIHNSALASIDGDVITIAANASYGAYDTNYIFKMDWKEKTQYTVSFKYRRLIENAAPTLAFMYTDNSFGAFNNYIGDGEWHEMIVTSAPNKTIKYIVAYLMKGDVDVSISSFMVNEGSTALPYEPYVAPTVKNIYLGQVPTTRRIRKLVLTGEERTIGGSDLTTFFYGIDPPALRTLGVITVASNCYMQEKNAFASTIYNVHPDYTICFAAGSTPAPLNNYSLAINDGRFDYSHQTNFKNYLKERYESGDPVVVWYVMYEPETGIVNEPLCKIGDYADSVDFSQAGVEIPTLPKGLTTVIDVETEVEPIEVDITYRGSTKPKYDLFLAQNGDSFEAKDGQSLYIGGNP